MRLIAFRTRRTTFPSTAPLIINEPVRDPKGKKRAAPDTSFDEEVAPLKRPRTSYSLRSRSDPTSSQLVDMPKKTRQARLSLCGHRCLRAGRSSITKGKMAIKGKALATAGSSRLEDEDIEMMDAAYHHDASELQNAVEHQVEEVEEVDEHDEEDEVEHNPTTGVEDTADAKRQDPPSESARAPGGLDESAALAIFGDYRQFGSYMLSLSSRLKTMLNNIKTTADPTTRLVTLQELSELLSISTEDTLAGSFQVEQFVRELVKILGGRGVDEDDDDEGDDDRPEQDEDAALAAALAMSTGGSTYQGDDNLEAQVLACRCLANLMEALPGVAHTVVYHGAIPVLCSKLIEISYIDLAEQTLSVSVHDS
jgi:E3 ubiquitin-protein ligase TRIP12